MDHAVDDSGGDHGIAEVVSEGFEVDVGSEYGGCFAVASVNDFEE